MHWIVDAPQGAAVEEEKARDMKRFDAWLMDWLDGQWSATLPGTRAADFWARLCLWQNDRYWRRHGEGPMVSNG